MSYGIQIKGLKEAQAKLGVNFKPVIQAATKAVAYEVQGKIAPYPPATIANSPSNPKGRWYERGYGPRWKVKSGDVHGRKTSETLGRRWAVAALQGGGHKIGNIASYAKFLHSERDQATWAGVRGWVTDKTAVQHVIRSGVVKRIVVQAIISRLRRP